jgi:hypothetical protein
MTTDLFFSPFSFPDYSLTFFERYPPVHLRNVLDELIVREKVELLYCNNFSSTNHQTVTLPALKDYYRCIHLLDLMLSKLELSIDEVREDLLNTTVSYAVSCWLSQDANVLSVDLTFPKNLQYGAVNKYPSITAYAVALIGFNTDLEEFCKHFPHLRQIKANCILFFKEVKSLITQEELLNVEKSVQDLYILSLQNLN